MYWWGAYGLVMLAVIVYRVIVPCGCPPVSGCGSPRCSATAAGAVTITMFGPHLDELEVAAGQYFVFRFVTGPGWTRAHPLSLSAAPTTHGLRVTMGVTGDDGQRIAGCARAPGCSSRARTAGCTRWSAPGPSWCSSAPGLGLAPLVALAQEAVLAGRLTDGPPC